MFSSHPHTQSIPVPSIPSAATTHSHSHARFPASTNEHLDIARSTFGGSPLAGSKHSTRIQLKSPFTDGTTQATQTPAMPIKCAVHSSLSSYSDGLDDVPMASEMGPSSAGYSSVAASSTHVTVYPSLPVPFPHPRPPSRNIIHLLHERQSRTVGVARIAFKRKTHAFQFGRFELRRSANTYETETSRSEFDHINMHSKSKVMEIVTGGNFVFALTHSGMCVAYDNRQSIGATRKRFFAQRNWIGS